MFRAISLLGFLLLGAATAYPCICQQTSHRKEFRRADAVFAGQVLTITEDKSFVPSKLHDPKLSPDTLARLQKAVDSQRRYIVRVKAERKFKGVEGQEITFYTYQSDSPCSGMVFTEGERYLFYTHREEGRLVDGGLCSRTRKLDKASKQYRELDSFWFRFRSRLPLPA